jgi:hypothetical protein
MQTKFKMNKYNMNQFNRCKIVIQNGMKKGVIWLARTIKANANTVEPHYNGRRL